MYVNRNAYSRYFFIACILSAFFWVNSAFAGNYSLKAGSVELTQGSTYNGQSVTSAAVVGLISSTGYASQAALRLTLADGATATIAKDLLLNGAKCLNLVGLCTANPVACGAVGVAIAGVGIYYGLQSYGGVLSLAQPVLDKIAQARDEATTPYSEPVFVTSPFNLPLCNQREDYYNGLTYCYTTSDFAPPKRIYSVGQTISNFNVIGNAVFPSTYTVTVAPNKEYIGLYHHVMSGYQFDMSGPYPVYHVSGSTAKPDFTGADVVPVNDSLGAKSIVNSIPVADRVIDDASSSQPPLFPDVYNPVSIDGSEGSISGYDSVVSPSSQVLSLANDGTVSQVSSVDGVSSTNVIPADPAGVVTTSPYVTDTSGSTTGDSSSSASASATATVTFDYDALVAKLKAMLQSLTDANNNTALSDANTGASQQPTSKTFDIMTYLSYGDSWLPAECPDDLSFDLPYGRTFVLPLHYACSYAPTMRIFVTVSSLITFVGIVVGGLKL